MIRVLEEEYINPFSIFADEDCFLNLSLTIPFNNFLAKEILQTEELGKKLAFAFAAERLVENEAKKFHEALPTTKMPSFKNTAKSATIRKNNKVCIVEVDRDILSWLVNFSARSGLVVNYENAMGYPSLPVSLSIATTEGGRFQKSKLLEIVTATLATPPNSSKLVISVDPSKSYILVIDLIAAIRMMTKISETYS